MRVLVIALIVVWAPCAMAGDTNLHRQVVTRGLWLRYKTNIKRVMASGEVSRESSFWSDTIHKTDTQGSTTTVERVRRFAVEPKDLKKVKEHWIVTKLSSEDATADGYFPAKLKKGIKWQRGNEAFEVIGSRIIETPLGPKKARIVKSTATYVNEKGTNWSYYVKGLGMVRHVSVQTNGTRLVTALDRVQAFSGDEYLKLGGTKYKLEK